MRIAYIYKITSPTNKIYIGSTINIKKRWNEYKGLKIKNQKKLLSSLLLYGYDNHIFEIVEECTVENRFEREAFYGNLFNSLDRFSGLNLRLPKVNEIYQCVSDETKINMSEKGKLRIGKLNPAFGNKRPDFALMAKERGLKLIGDKNPMFGTKRPKYIKDALKKARLKKEAEGNSPRNKIVIDINTGIYYKSAMEVIRLYLLKKSTFVSMLNGRLNNTTSFKYA